MAQSPHSSAPYIAKRRRKQSFGRSTCCRTTPDLRRWNLEVVPEQEAFSTLFGLWSPQRLVSLALPDVTSCRRNRSRLGCVAGHQGVANLVASFSCRKYSVVSSRRVTATQWWFLRCWVLGEQQESKTEGEQERWRERERERAGEREREQQQIERERDIYIHIYIYIHREQETEKMSERYGILVA